MAILGLMTAESFASQRFKNYRRSVFYFYPNGTAPLIGLLSMLKDEVTNDPEFHWWEKRMLEQRTILATITSNKCFYSAVDSTWTTWTAASADITFTSGTQYGIKVAASGTAQFRTGHVIRFFTYNAAETALLEVQGVVAYVDAANNRMAFVCNTTIAAIKYDSTTAAGREVLVIGNAFGEGALSNSTTGTSTMNVYNVPTDISNYTQIFRTPYQITGTALKTSAQFDTEGVFPDQAKEGSVNHMRELEYSVLFGKKATGTNAGQPIRYSGGILYFMGLWEAGSTYGNTAATADTDDTKRIIANSSGVLSSKTYNTYLERGFRNIRNKTGEILCLCGSGFLMTLNNMYEGKACLESSLPLTDTYGMNVTSHQTPFGKVYYKTHPLFSLNATLRFNALFIDMGNIKYRPLNGRDTELLKDRQPNNADYIENEYLTEAGFEVDSPESHLYIQNVQDWAP